MHFKLQIEAEMQRVAELSEQAAHLQQTVSGQRRQMGGLDAATKEENQVGSTLPSPLGEDQMAVSCSRNVTMYSKANDLPPRAGSGHG